MTAPSPFRSLPLDGSEGAVARLRIVAAVAVGLGALWLAAVRPSAGAWLCILAGLGASLMWLAMGMRGRRRAASAERHRLDLEPTGLVLVEGPEERRVDWGAVESVTVDEERLVVSIRVRGDRDLCIEPRYGGLGAYALQGVIQGAMRAARDPNTPLDE